MVKKKMRKIEEIGTCTNCDCSLFIYKTNNYKRFVKCEICGFSYALPKRGTISNSALLCPTKQLPLLIIEKKDQKAYFWSEGPCFTCISFDKCPQVGELITEFTEMEVYGY